MRHYKSNAELAADGRKSLLGHLGPAVWSILLYIVINFLLNQIVFPFNLKNGTLSLAVNTAVTFIRTLFGGLFGVGLTSVFLSLQYGQPTSVRQLFSFLENADTCIRVRFLVTVGEFLCLLPARAAIGSLAGAAVSAGAAAAESGTASFSDQAAGVLSGTVSTAGVDPAAAAARLPIVLPIIAVSALAWSVWTLTFSMTNYLLLDFPEMSAWKIVLASRQMMKGSRIRLLRLVLRLLPLHLLSMFSFGMTGLWTAAIHYATIAAFYRDLISQA